VIIVKALAEKIKFRYSHVSEWWDTSTLLYQCIRESWVFSMDKAKGGRAAEHVVYINRAADQPVYLQLAESLRQQILAGKYRPGERLPSETRLVEMYQVSPMTVRRAINFLTSQDIVTTARGSGTFVKEVELGAAAFYLQDLKALFDSNGGTTVRLLEARFCPADRRVARKLRIAEGIRAIYIRRLLLVNGQPAFYHRGYLVNDPHRPVVEAELGVTDLKGLFTGSGSSLIKFGDLNLESTLLNEEEATVLRLKTAAPGMVLEHLFYDFNNAPVSWGWFVCASTWLRLHTRVGID
jgi:DNA-binding GntR family transcriptional regulator